MKGECWKRILCVSAVLLLGTGRPAAAQAQTILHDKATSTPAPDPENDPNKVVITDIAAWRHPTKAVFAKYRMVLTEVVLVRDRTYPIFHVADFHADPTSGMTNGFFDRFNLALLEANGFHGFTVLENNGQDGFAVSYDKATHRIISEPIAGDDR